ncbi:hypothetical protein ACFL6C_07670 [Myxococcota bacterium]
MTIRNDQDLAQALEQLARLYRALAALRREVQSQSQASFALLTEGPIDQLRQIQAEIERYVGISDTTERGT